MEKEHEGTVLLKLFREEQRKKGHIGCDCTDCAEDMDNALKKFRKGGKDENKKIRIC